MWGHPRVDREVFCRRKGASAGDEMRKDSSSWSLSVWLLFGKDRARERGRAPRPENGARVGVKASPELARHQEGHRIRAGTQVSLRP